MFAPAARLPPRWRGAARLSVLLRAPMRVVGVAEDVRFASIFDDPPPVAYVPAAQHPGHRLLLLVRGREGRAVPEVTLRAMGEAIDARVPLYTRAVSELIDAQTRPQRVASAWIRWSALT